MSRFEARIEVAIARARADVSRLQDSLVRAGLGTFASGSLSARVADADLFVITPQDLTQTDNGPESMVVVALDGTIVDGIPGSEALPSRGAEVHAELYRSGADIGGIVHTRSPYMSAFSVRGETVPCITIDAAEEFGGPVPVLGYDADGIALSARIREQLDAQRSRAVLIERHGAYALGSTLRDALRTATLLEETARATQLARAGLASAVDVASLDAALIDTLHERRLRGDTALATRAGHPGAYSTSRSGAPGSSGGTGSWTTPAPTAPTETETS